jgi:hypothetical protein
MTVTDAGHEIGLLAVLRGESLEYNRLNVKSIRKNAPSI